MIGRFDGEEGGHEGNLDRRGRWTEGKDAEDKGKPDGLKVWYSQRLCENQPIIVCEGFGG